jgi:hypothetical protein
LGCCAGAEVLSVADEILAADVRAAKDPTAEASFAINDSRSLAIELPAVVAMSDLIAELSGAEPTCEGAIGLSPLQPLASISTAARVIKRLERFCIMTPLLFG